MRRRLTSTPDLDRREGQWWARYGELEERYCWVLPERFQPLARLRYLDHLVAALARHEVIVDYGCGTGWLSLMLARRTQARIVGVDRFGSQIERARDNARRLGIQNVGFMAIHDLESLPVASAYVFHGVLHHLAADEIDALFETVRNRQGGAADLMVVEPTVYPGAGADAVQERLWAEAGHLFSWRDRAARLSFAKVHPQEARMRAMIDGRWAGEAPHGPSPKEKPFEGDELATYLGQRFRVIEERPVQCLALSQRMSSDLALAELSQPGFVRLFGPFLRRRIAGIERRLLATDSLPDHSWYMSLIHCTTA